MMRLLLILLISFALPVHGFASLAAALPPCSTEQDGHSAPMDLEDDACCCCDDADADAGKNDKLCESGTMCKTSPVFQAIFGSSAVFPAPVNPAVLQSSPVAITCDATGVWRPPRLL